MKTIRDFKGNKGEFIFRKEGESLVIDSVYKNGSHMAFAQMFFPKTGDYPQKAEANAKLFAASKKLLEAAIEVVQSFKNSPKWSHRTIDQEDKLDKLEQAINDAL